MANKYLAVSGNDTVEVEATVTSAGAGDAGEIVALDAGGKIDSTLLPTGVGADSLTVTASEALSAGDFINLHVSSGTKMRKADSSNGRRAHGFVKAAVLSSATGTAYFDGSNDQVSGLTVGTVYFLSTTGGVTATAPTTATHIMQEVGVATSATSISFEPSKPITRA